MRNDLLFTENRVENMLTLKKRERTKEIEKDIAFFVYNHVSLIIVVMFPQKSFPCFQWH